MSAINAFMIGIWVVCAIAFIVVVLLKTRAKHKRNSKEVDDFLTLLFLDEDERR